MVDHVLPLSVEIWRFAVGEGNGLGLAAVAFAVTRWPLGHSDWAGWAFLAGTVLFSGSLYALSLSGIRALGAVTPLGGVCFLAGWALLAWGVAASGSN